MLKANLGTWRIIGALALCLGLLACGNDDNRISVGAKNFSESRILAHMMAELIRAGGIDDVVVIDYENTQSIQEALKRGDIDAYPEYNGTGLIMLGQNPIADGDEATQRVKELYEPLGFTWLPRLGFANTYGLAMLSERATELGVSTISDLIELEEGLGIGVEDDFVRRPLDGLEPMLLRYGLSFDETVDVPLDERLSLYNRLLDGDVDVIEVYTTDGQIADYGLTLLEDDLNFFSAYEAAMLVRASTLSKHPALGASLERLGGQIDGKTMRDLNRRVAIEGRSAQAVARDALARLGLIDSGSVQTEEPLMIALSPFLREGSAASDALRSARAAFEGRNVQVMPTHRPLQAVANGSARVALVGAGDLFDLGGPTPLRNDSYEAVAPIGQLLVHVVVASDGPETLADVTNLATGPDESSGRALADVLKTGLSLQAAIVPVNADSTALLLDAIDSGDADAALLVVPIGDAALLQAMHDADYRLLPIDNWHAGANLIRYPFLRETRINAEAYPGQSEAVDTLGMQLVLAGPAPDTAEVVGDQGPSSIATRVPPLSNPAVLAMNAASPTGTFLDPTLRQAAALMPELPEPVARMNPDPDVSLLSVLVVALFIWLIYMLVRPEYR